MKHLWLTHRSVLVIAGLIAGVIVFLVGLTWLYHFLGIDWELYVVTTISLISLVISMVSLFKNELLPFRLEIVPSNLLLIATDPPMPGPVVVLTICFTNSGYSDAVVDLVGLTVVDGNRHKLYLLPADELAWSDLYKTRFVITPDTPKSLFTAFLVPARSSLVKTFSFDRDIPGSVPVLSVPGKHTFGLFVKTVSWKDAKRLASFELDVSTEAIASVKLGKPRFYSLFPWPSVA